MGVHHAPREFTNSREGRCVGDGVVTRSHHDIVKFLSVQHLVILQVLYRDSEIVSVFDNPAGSVGIVTDGVVVLVVSGDGGSGAAGAVEMRVCRVRVVIS